MSSTNIVICGGHFAPAVAIIEALRKEEEYALFFFGRKKSAEGDNAYSLEYQIVNKWKIPFYSINTGRLQRSFTRYTFLSLFRLPIGFMQSLFYLLKIRPKAVIGFGGYVSLPVCLAAFFIQIPIIVHEQTPILGLTNRIIAPLAKIICLSYKETKYVPVKIKRVVTGIPIRNAIFLHKDSRLCHFGDENLPLLYITGGSLGARSINKKIVKVIPSLLGKYRILHQCGSTEKERDFIELNKLKSSLSKELRVNYQIVKKIEPDEVGSILHKAYIVISRAGANTVAEIAALGKPAILIPLPWSADNEQLHNALILQKTGLVKIIDQENLTKENIIREIDFIQENINEFHNAFFKSKKIFSSGAAFKIVKIINSIIEN